MLWGKGDCLILCVDYETQLEMECTPPPPENHTTRKISTIRKKRCKVFFKAFEELMIVIIFYIHLCSLYSFIYCTIILKKLQRHNF
jgi:hypothetical protein